MVRTETGDGAALAGRPELGTILDFIHPGETLSSRRMVQFAPSPQKGLGYQSPRELERYY